MLRNRLRPFHPEDVDARVLPLSAVQLDESAAEQLGFDVGSRQWMFLERPGADKFVSLVCERGTAPTSFTDARVVACAFGTQGTRGDVELWHVSVRRQHPYNDTQGGTRWGVHGIARVDGEAKVRWKTRDGTRLAFRNHEHRVRGTPNPYAVAAIYALHGPNVTSMVQNSSLPCAQLFHGHYDHATHPATQVLYRSLGFQRSSMGNYVWYRDQMPPMEDMHALLVERMQDGKTAVACRVVPEHCRLLGRGRRARSRPCRKNSRDGVRVSPHRVPKGCT